MRETKQGVGMESVGKTGTFQFLTFRIGASLYGIEILCVREIKSWQEPTKIPNSRNYMRGVIDLRGTVIPVIDVGIRFQNQETQVSDKSVIIVMEKDDQNFGIIVDSVCDIYEANQSEIKPAPQQTGEMDDRYVAGIFSRGNEMVILLEAAALVESKVLEEIANEESDRVINANITSY